MDSRPDGSVARVLYSERMGCQAGLGGTVQLRLREGKIGWEGCTHCTFALYSVLAGESVVPSQKFREEG